VCVCVCVCVCVEAKRRKLSRVVDRVVPLPISLSYLSLILLLYRSPPPPGGLFFFPPPLAKQTNKKKLMIPFFNPPSLVERNVERDTQAVACYFILTVIYINVSPFISPFSLVSPPPLPLIQIDSVFISYALDTAHCPPSLFEFNSKLSFFIV